MKMRLKTVIVATATFACTALFSLSWSGHDGLVLSSNKAEAAARIVVRPGYAASSAYTFTEGMPWYAVRAYYLGGPWSGDGYTYASWDEYAKRNGIACVPGSAVKGQDGIMYRCQ